MNMIRWLDRLERTAEKYRAWRELLELEPVGLVI